MVLVDWSMDPGIWRGFVVAILWRTSWWSLVPARLVYWSWRSPFWVEILLVVNSVLVS